MVKRTKATRVNATPWSRGKWPPGERKGRAVRAEQQKNGTARDGQSEHQKDKREDPGAPQIT